MNKSLRSYLKQNDFITIIYRLLTSRKYRDYCADYKRNGRIFRFEHLGTENPGAKIYLIIEGDSFEGMFALIIWTLRRLEVADRFCFIPVVTWSEDIPYAVRGYSNQFLPYFQPVSEISMESARKSEDVVFANTWDRAYGSPADSYDFCQDEINRLARIYNQYMHLQQDIQFKIESDVAELIGKVHGKVLGVHVRGVDWRKTRIAGHPVALMEEDYLQATQDMMEDLGYEKIFLASDSESTINLFRTKFGNKLITTQSIRTSESAGDLVIFNEKNDGFQMGFEVLRDAYALSSCHSLLCGLSYVSYGARIIKQARGFCYEKVVVFDKGTVKNGLSIRAAEIKERKNSANKREK